MEQMNEIENSYCHFTKKEKYRIIIWGAGNTARQALRYKSDTVEILGFLDNNSNIKEFDGLQALEKEKLCKYDYDYIVICSCSHEEIYKQLLGMVGVLRRYW